MRRKGQGRPLLLLQGLESWIRDEEFSEPLARNHEVLLPQNPGFGHSELPDDFREIGDFAQFYLHMLDEQDLNGGGTRRHVVRRLDCGRDGEPLLRPDRFAGAGQSVRNPAERGPDGARHPGHLRHVAGRGRKRLLPRPRGQPPGRHAASRPHARRHRPVARDDVPVRLEAVHAQPLAQALAETDPRADAHALGRERRRDERRLRARLRREDPRGGIPA